MDDKDVLSSDKDWIMNEKFIPKEWINMKLNAYNKYSNEEYIRTVQITLKADNF